MARNFNIIGLNQQQFEDLTNLSFLTSEDGGLTFLHCNEERYTEAKEIIRKHFGIKGDITIFAPTYSQNLPFTIGIFYQL